MAKLADYFEKKDEAGINYTVLDVPYSQRKDVREAAEKMGQPKMVEFDKPTSEWRLIGDLVPKGTKSAQIDAAFGQWKTPEAAAAVAAEREAFAAGRIEKAAAVVGKSTPEIAESRRYYPVANEKGERPEWTAALAALKSEGTEVRYNGSIKAFVHQKGPTEGLEAFQTPEAKAAWDAKGRHSTSRADTRREVAGSSLDAQAFEAKGELLMAASVKGFSLPSKESHAAERTAALALVKGAPDTELSTAFQVTEVAKKRLEAKLYGIQISVVEKEAASKKGADLTNGESKAIRTDFNKMDANGRREAAKFIGLDNQEFGQMVGVRSGFFALRDEMVGRGLVQTKEQALETKQQDAPAAEKPAQAPKAQAKTKGQSAGLAAALASGQGR